MEFWIDSIRWIETYYNHRRRNTTNEGAGQAHPLCAMYARHVIRHAGGYGFLDYSKLPKSRTGISPAPRKSFSHFFRVLQPTPKFWTQPHTQFLLIEIVLLNCLSCYFAIIRSSFFTIPLLHHILLIENFLILTCTIFMLAARSAQNSQSCHPLLATDKTRTPPFQRPCKRQC